MSLLIKAFSWTPVGTYNGYGTRINIRAELRVLKKIILKRQLEVLDGKVILDYIYPSNQPITEPSDYVWEEKDYAHVPFLLDFCLFGHIYKITWEYLDLESGKIMNAFAEARAFKTEEKMVDFALIGTTVAGLLFIGISALKKGKD